MSFKTAVKYLTDYRTQRALALNNQQVQRWSTTPAGTLVDMVKVFDSSTENAAWNKEYNINKAAGAISSDKSQALRLGINFLAGCRRDVRMQYGSGPVTRSRADTDFTRFEFSRLAYENYLMTSAEKRLVSYLQKLIVVSKH